MAIKPRSKGDEGKISQSITRLCEEDSTISYEMNTETKQQVISGLGEQHLDVIVSKLKSKFGVDVDLEEPIVPYRETIRKKVKVNGRHKKQTAAMASLAMFGLNLNPAWATTLYLKSEYSAARCQKASSRRWKKACATALSTARWQATLWWA